MKITAYKVFNPDWTCMGFQYKVGKSYTTDKPTRLCEWGFHACEKLIDCFNYYSFDPNNKVAVVELSGKVLGVGESDKLCGSKIKILKEVSWEEVLRLCNTGNRNTGYGNTGYGNTGDCNTGDWNTGNWNTGDCNTGNWNTGYGNTGYCNTGNWNTGDCNTGYWNTGYCNTGYFNSITPQEILVFNKPCKREDWNNAYKPSFLYFSIIKWIEETEMTGQEKTENPNYKTIGGYLKKLDYKEAFKISWNNASQEDRDAVKKLPNFDKDIFFEISGIKI